MSLLQEIKKQQIDARRNKNALKAGALTLLISDSERIGKDDGGREVTDADVLKVVKRHLDGVNDCLSRNITDQVREDKTIELEILTSFMPKQLTKEDMIDIVKKLDADSDIVLELPMLMQYFKTVYPSQYDGKLLSTTVKEILSTLPK